MTALHSSIGLWVPALRLVRSSTTGTTGIWCRKRGDNGSGVIRTCERGFFSSRKSGSVTKDRFQTPCCHLPLRCLFYNCWPFMPRTFVQPIRNLQSAIPFKSEPFLKNQPTKRRVGSGPIFCPGLDLHSTAAILNLPTMKGDKNVRP